MRQKIRKGILTFSALLFPLLFLFLSPYLIIAAASLGVFSGSAIVFGLLFITSLLSSRLFCGWICPGGAWQDFAAGARDKPWNGKVKNALKYIIWAVWFGFIIYLWLANRPLRADFTFMAALDGHAMILYFMITTLIVVIALSTGKRGLCHSLCWMAPFMVFGEKLGDLLHLPRFRLKANSTACVSCGKCTRACPMSLNVAEMVKTGKMDSVECIGCLSCADGCPKKAISCAICRR